MLVTAVDVAQLSIVDRTCIRQRREELPCVVTAGRWIDLDDADDEAEVGVVLEALLGLPDSAWLVIIDAHA